MEKRGVIDENTPTSLPVKPAPPATKQAADQIEDSLPTRLAKAAEELTDNIKRLKGK